MKLIKLKRAEFDEYLNSLFHIKQEDHEYIYKMYTDVFETLEANYLEAAFTLGTIDQKILLAYIVNEYIYYLSNNINHEEIDSRFEEDILKDISAYAIDKYLTNEKLNFENNKFLSRFSPIISTIDLYFNFMLENLRQLKLDNKYDNLIKDILFNSITMGKCIINLLVSGFSTEAFSTWRTLHENESILYCLALSNREVFDAYFEHIKYAVAYRGGIDDKEQVDAIFDVIKEKMRKYGLKSKDMKKFIEYGYLFELKNKEFGVDYKLNFRDGVEKIAGLASYAESYEMASEIAHGSPLLLVSKKQYYFDFCLINLYESFFRLEKIFSGVIQKSDDEKLINYYKESLKGTYLAQCTKIYHNLLNIVKLKNS